MTFTAVMGVIVEVLIGIFGVSALAAFLNNKAIKDRIERNGEYIDYTDSSVTERITYFLQDYAYLLVPIYNFKKSVIDNFFKKTAKTYEDERRAKYVERKLIRKYEGDKKPLFHKFKKVEKETKEEEKEVVKEVVKEKAATKTVNREAEVVKTKVPERINKTTKVDSEIKAPKKQVDSFKSLDEEYAYYKKLFEDRKQEYYKAEDEMILSYSQREKMYNELISTQTHLKSIEKRVELQKQISAKKSELSSLMELLETENKSLK